MTHMKDTSLLTLLDNQCFRCNLVRNNLVVSFTDRLS